MERFRVTGSNPSASYDLGVFIAKSEQDAIQQARVVRHWHDLGDLALSARLSPETRRYIVAENERLFHYARRIKCAVFQRARISARRLFQQALEV